MLHEISEIQVHPRDSQQFVSLESRNAFEKTVGKNREFNDSSSEQKHINIPHYLIIIFILILIHFLIIHT